VITLEQLTAKPKESAGEVQSELLEGAVKDAHKKAHHIVDSV